MGADLVQKVPVVRNDYDRVFEIQQIVFQPTNGFDIQIVRRLVQNQNIRIAKERLRQQHLDLEFSIKLAHERPMQTLIDFECVQKGSSFALCLPPVQLSKFILELSGQYAVFLGEIRLRIENVLLFGNFHEPFMTEHDRMKHSLVVEGILVLIEHREALVFVNDDLPFVWFQFPG